MTDPEALAAKLEALAEIFIGPVDIESDNSDSSASAWWNISTTTQSITAHDDGEALVVLLRLLPRLAIALRSLAATVGRQREALEPFVRFFDAHEAKLKWEGSHKSNNWDDWRTLKDSFDAASEEARRARAALQQEGSNG